MDHFMAAVVQMDSQDQVRENLKQAAYFIAEAAERGAKLVALPENVNYIGSSLGTYREQIPDGETFCVFSDLAKKYGIWLHCGSISEGKAEEVRPWNTTMLLDPRGRLAARYRKLHPFDVEIQNGPVIQESDRICPGSNIVTVDTKEVGQIGFAICYDIRFCELFRFMALQGAQVFITPADFTAITGKDHWEVLLRARAIENGCYVLAPGQTGMKPNYQSYGNSMIIDPWGNVIAKAANQPGVILGEVDLRYLGKVRSQIRTLENRRTDLYELREIHP